MDTPASTVPPGPFCPTRLSSHSWPSRQDAALRKRRLFESYPVDDAVVAATLSAGWPGAKLGPRLKSSQNVTYSGELANGQARALSCGVWCGVRVDSRWLL